MSWAPLLLYLKVNLAGAAILNEIKEIRMYETVDRYMCVRYMRYRLAGPPSFA